MDSATSITPPGERTPSAAGALLAYVRRALPRGRSLPDDVWRRRHRGIVLLLWAHALGVTAFALAAGCGIQHSAFHGAVIAAAALVARWERPTRGVRAGAASIGLVTSSAVLVHLSGGYIELHFHFFVMVGLMALYQDWLPFLLAIGYVVIHHGVAGVVEQRDRERQPPGEVAEGVVADHGDVPQRGADVGAQLGDLGAQRGQIHDTLRVAGRERAEPALQQRFQRVELSGSGL